MTNPGLSGGRAMLELAERVEKATGPDRELDIAIATGAAGWRHQPHVAHNFKWHDGRFDVPGPPPKFTASLDAAMTLVPGEWRFAGSESMAGGFYTHLITRELVNDGAKAHAEAHADTLALAITAAALRARAADTPSVKP